MTPAHGAGDVPAEELNTPDATSAATSASEDTGGVGEAEDPLDRAVAAQSAAAGRRRRRGFATGASWAVQLLLTGLGAYVVLFDDSILVIVVWCLLGSTYATVVVVLLAALARRREDRQGPPASSNRVIRIISVATTIVPALVGGTAAVQLVIVRDTDTIDALLIRIVGVWAVVLAWGFLHWGFAQLYAGAHDEQGRSPFEFAEIDRPGIVDFVYLAFTVGTTFAVSDVTARTTRVRWLLTVHSVSAFIMNGLVIVLAFNTITAS